jgi:hypothetical protein
MLKNITQLTMEFSAKSIEILLLEPSLLPFVEQLLRCGRKRGDVRPKSKIECAATK